MVETENPASSPAAREEEKQEPDPKRIKTTTTTTNSDSEKKPRYKRRKIAILFAYCGVGYQGMQKNPGAKTIEGDLEEALYFSGAVPENDRGCPKRFDFARSARTDKGVSAVGQVVSGKFYVDPPGFIQRLNDNLPPQFRVFGFKRVTASFSAKKFCDRRRYVYLLPVFALDPASHELVDCLECSKKGWKVFGAAETQSGILSNTFSALGSADSKMENLASLGNNLNGCIDQALNSESVIVEAQSGITSNTFSALRSSDGKMENLASLDNNLNGCIDQALDSGSVIVEAQSGITSNTFSALGSADGKMENLASLDNNLNGCIDQALNSESVIVEVQSLESCDDNNCSSDAVNGSSNVRKNVFCYDDEKRQRFNKILKQYEGTHNFHNFTTRTKAADPSAKRYIISFHANTTVTVDGMEFVKCEVVGQSFMLHQIRKMIGVAVAIMRNCAPESLMETALQQDVRITVPTAPEVGLYLDECFFSSYNQKWGNTHEEVSMKDYADEAEEFKLKHIYSHIASTEHKEGAVAVWLHSLNHRSYPDLAPEEKIEANEDLAKNSTQVGD